MAQQLVTIKTPLLMGGISKQPAHLRYPHQVEDADNAAFSIVDGVSKRNGTTLLRRLCGTQPTGGDVRTHPIDRDGSEQYLVFYGSDVPSTIKVVPLNGDQESTVNISADAAAYLALNSPTADELRLVTIADYTLILNTTVPVSTTSADTYSTTAQWRDYDVMVASTPADDTFHESLNSITDFAKGFYHYDVDGTTFAKIRFAEISGHNLTEVTGQWNDGAGAPRGFTIRFRKKTCAISGGAWTQATKRLVKSGAFAGYTWAGGDVIQITGGTGVTAGFREIAAKISNNEIELVATTGFTLDQTNITTDGIATQHDASVGQLSTTPDMYGVAAEIQQSLRDGGAEDALCSWTSTGFQLGYFTITSPYRGAEATVYPPVSGGFSTDLSAAGQAFNGVSGYTITAGVGSGSLTLAVDLRWTKVLPSGQPDTTIDPLLMPVKMVRTTLANPAVFDIDTIDWDDRITGDEVSNPSPSLWQKHRTISDIGFFRERLVLCGGENIVLSETNNFFNFYLKDAPTVADSDPIDVSISSDEVTLTDYAVQLQDSMQVLTLAGRQFDLSAIDALTPSTARIRSTTNYKTLSVRPRTLDQFLYFVGRLGCNTQLLEYPYSESTVAASANDVSRHYAGELPEDMRTVVVSTNNRTAYMLGADSNVIHVYQAFWDESGEKLQSAWSRFTFDDDYSICDIALIQNQLYMLVKRGTEFMIERMPVAPEQADCDLPVFTACPVSVVDGCPTVGPYNFSDTFSGDLSLYTDALNHYIISSGKLYCDANPGYPLKYRCYDAYETLIVSAKIYTFGGGFVGGGVAACIQAGEDPPGIYAGIERTIVGGDTAVRLKIGTILGDDDLGSHTFGVGADPADGSTLTLTVDAVDGSVSATFGVGTVTATGVTILPGSAGPWFDHQGIRIDNFNIVDLT